MLVLRYPPETKGPRAHPLSCCARWRCRQPALISLTFPLFDTHACQGSACRPRLLIPPIPHRARTPHSPDEDLHAFQNTKNMNDDPGGEGRRGPTLPISKTARHGLDPVGEGVATGTGRQGQGSPFEKPSRLPQLARLGTKPPPAAANPCSFQVIGEGARERTDRALPLPKPRARPTFRDEPTVNQRVRAGRECAAPRLRLGAGDINWGPCPRHEGESVLFHPYCPYALTAHLDGRWPSAIPVHLRTAGRDTLALPNTHVRPLRPEDRPTRPRPIM